MTTPNISLDISPVDSTIRIIVNLMIKNESKIIERCIRSTLSIADAICISDTGSTDNTLEVIQNLQTTLHDEGIHIPFKIFNHSWNNFGHNRTLSFNSSQIFAQELNFNLNYTYALLIDADMTLINTSFNKQSLTHPGYLLIQQNNTIEYHNTRFVKLSSKWNCIGYTHEYWNLDENGKNEPIPSSIIYINDFGDGGCKDDKFKRDLLLLEAELIEKPNNPRSLFYIAQTHWCLKNIEKAIEYYKKRIDAGGWFEEIYYSMYMISKAYLALDNEIDAEYWALKAFKFNPKRSESIYLLARHFRLTSSHYKSFHYIKQGIHLPKPDDRLFIEKNIYSHLFKYEATIIYYYIKQIKEGLLHSLDYLKNYSENYDNVYHNLLFYLKNFSQSFPSIPFSKHNLNFPLDGDFHPSSTSIIEFQHQIIANIRYVNYNIVNGSYIMTQNNQESPSFPVKTINKSSLLSTNLDILHINNMKNINLSSFPSNIQGLEDLRLFCFDNQNIKFLASSKDLSDTGNINITYGDYDYLNSEIKNVNIIPSPTNSKCEKNWIMLDHETIIYNWNPFTIAKLSNNSLNIIQTTPTQGIIKHLRGSSNFIQTKPNTYVGILHGIFFDNPRKYYHIFVEIKYQNSTYQISRHSIPFFFNNLKIEYCLGFLISGSSCYIIFSQNDNHPSCIKFNYDLLENVFI